MNSAAQICGVWAIAAVCFLNAALCLAQDSNRIDRSPQWLLPMGEVDADPAVPTSEQVLGHAWGAEISNHRQIERYLEALAEAAPDRTRLVKYGESYGSRALYYLVIAKPEHLANLETIRANNLRLADPRGLSTEEAQQLIDQSPAIVWLSYSVHGNEISCSDAALLTAYHLLADRSPATQEILEQCVVIIDPLQNPDGRERFVNAYRETRGLFPQSDPASNEHTEYWPGGRQNHYWFDMNRDWFLQSQQESRAKIAAYLDWHPQIFVDAHEMGRNSTYYFAPPTDPINPFLLPRQHEWFFRIGKHQAEQFDNFGFSYTTREMFDAFYPGYGSEWPTLQGGLGILWEQASARGIVVDRNDDTKLHYHDGVRHHYVSGIATVEVAAMNKTRLLTDFHDARQQAVRLGSEGPVRHFFLLEGADPHRCARLAATLQRNGIEVGRTTAGLSVECTDTRSGQTSRRSIPRGSYHIAVAQPAGRLIRTLLDREIPMDDAFVKRQLARNEHRLPDEIYDVTAWSLPLAFDVTCYAAGAAESLETEPWDGAPRQGSIGDEPARVAYLIQPTDGAMIALADWLQQGLRVHVAERSITFGDRHYRRGTLVVKTNENPADLHDTMVDAVSRFGIDVGATDTGFVDAGAHLGGPYVTWIRPPRILIVTERPASYSVGHTWYLFDQILGYPTTRVAARNFGRIDLDDYNVMLLPEGSYGGPSGFGPATGERLSEWVRNGGTLITVRGGTRWAASEEIGLLANQRAELPLPPPGGAAASGEEESDGGDHGTEAPPTAPGAFLRASTFEEHWVTYGYPRELDVFFTGNTVLTKTPVDKGRALVTFAGRDNLLSSGFCWPTTLDLLADSPYVVYRSSGQGHVVAFIDDPNYRAMYPALQRLFINAAMFGPAY